MTIFVIGPSRVGKTALLRAVLPEFPTLRLLELDADERLRVAAIRTSGGDPGGWEARWHRNLECIRVAESSGGCSIVDVGAGSLQTDAATRFFVEHGSSAIAVFAPWEVVFQRYRNRDADEFRQTEYSDERLRVYDAAQWRVNSACAFAESVIDFRVAVRAAVGREVTSV